jgi:hypothetical protein
MVQTTTGTFQHVGATTPAGCSCPIHRSQEREPFTAPLGLPFAEQVTVEEIPVQTAEAIYAAHHAYKDDAPGINKAHHGIYYQGSLMGAITWRYALGKHKAVYMKPDGSLVAAPVNLEDYPERIQPMANELLVQPDCRKLVSRDVVSKGTFMSASRICIGVDMANLASAALARSQEQYVRDYADEEDTEYLQTFVRADYPGSMIRALRDKGWRCVGISEPSTTSNRDHKPIRDRFKWDFVCRVEQVKEQSQRELTDYSQAGQ